MNEPIELNPIAATMRQARARARVIDFDPRYTEEVLARAREMHAESEFHRQFPLDEERLIKQLRAGEQLPHVYFRICVLDEEVLGGFFGIITTLYFSQERVAQDLAWFVKRSVRGSAAAVALLADFEEWARSKGISHVLIGQTTSVNMDKTRALYERLGYKTIGVNTVKRIA